MARAPRPRFGRERKPGTPRESGPQPPREERAKETRPGQACGCQCRPGHARGQPPPGGSAWGGPAGGGSSPVWPPAGAELVERQPGETRSSPTLPRGAGERRRRRRGCAGAGALGGEAHQQQLQQPGGGGGRGGGGGIATTPKSSRRKWTVRGLPMRTQEVNASVMGALAPCRDVFPWEGASSSSSSSSSSKGAGVLLPTFSAAAQARVAITLLLCVVSTACNVAVLWAGTSGRPARRSHARVLLRHLAGADLLVALVVMPLDAAWNVTLQWRGGDVACRLLMFLRLLAMYASAFVTALISLDRQAAILHPLAIAEAWRRNQILLHAAWVLSAGLSIPQLFLFHTVTISSPQNFTQCTTQGSFAQRWHETAYNMLTFLCLFLLPLLIMVACYSRILLEISRRTRSPSTSQSARELPLRRSRNPIPRARLRMLCLSVAIVGSFVVCWTPYYLLGLWYWFWPAAMEGAVPRSLTHILFLFGLLNACLDPITYGLFTLPLRRRLGGGCWGRGARLQPPSPLTGSFHCSASSLRARRGGLPHPEPTGEAAQSPNAWPKEPVGSSCL